MSSLAPTADSGLNNTIDNAGDRFTNFGNSLLQNSDEINKLQQLLQFLTKLISILSQFANIRL